MLRDLTLGPNHRFSQEPHRLDRVNRAPRWLLPTVLVVLLAAVVLGTMLH
jgi:hypothetical protein